MKKPKKKKREPKPETVLKNRKKLLIDAVNNFFS